MPLDKSLMRAIAVLVISCPCAMGLATPAAISVGLGRAARQGIIYRNAGVLESFRHIRQVVFDKTGTLTTGKFKVADFETILTEHEFRAVVYSIELHSTHPIAQSICEQWPSKEKINWKAIEEKKGEGMKTVDRDGNIFELGNGQNKNIPADKSGHDLYLFVNDVFSGWIDIMDEIRPEINDIMQWMKKENVEPILLTGDNERKAAWVANATGISKVFSRQTPADKCQKIEELSAIAPTAMVGDGINDAPALAKATIGISIAEASQLAVQNADVVMLHGQLSKLPLAFGLGKHTYLTVKQNLAWAFAYNIIAIPIAALGFLTPTFAAISMGLSDVMLALISLHLFIKKVN
jgi:Cu+-exporting ATPase